MSNETEHNQDAADPKYTQADVLRAIPTLKAGTFQMWMARGLVKPTLENPGPGQKRRFSVREIIRLGIMCKLVEFSIAVGKAALISNFMISNMDACKWMIAYRVGDHWSVQCSGALPPLNFVAYDMVLILKVEQLVEQIVRLLPEKN